MKCLVCGKNYEAAECPRCRFPDIHIPGDRQKVLESLKPTIDSYRASFMNRVQLDLVTYRWKDQEGVVALDREERIALGSADRLQQETKWLPEKFARIPDAPEITVRVRATVGTDSYDLDIAVPNLQSPQLQQLGISLDQDCNIRLQLRNDTDAPTSSAAVPLFA